MNLAKVCRTAAAIGPVNGGTSVAIRLAAKIRPLARHALKKMRLKGILHPVFLRPGTSDLNVYAHIFVSRGYAFPRKVYEQAVRGFYEDLLRRSATPLIIDCGANIGLSSIWYAQQFPQAKIIAIEPEPENFRILSMNAAEYPNIQPMQGGISDRETRLALANVGDAPWAWETVENDTGPIRSYSIPALLAMQPARTTLMLVKVDIEGGEVALFRSNVDWVLDTPVIVFEAHDWLFQWRGTFHAVASALTRMPRDYVQQGENTFSFSHAALAPRRAATNCADDHAAA
jgi:FkbM family methyltransferase